MPRVQPTVVFDLDKVLLGGDASTLFLSGRLRQAPRRALPLLLAAPLLMPGSAVSDFQAVADSYGRALARKPEAAVADAIACLRRHQQDGDRVVVATGCEETLARGFLRAIGLGDLDVVGSTGVLWPPRVRWAMGESKVAMLAERGYPPPWTAVYSDSASDLPLFAGTNRPVLVNAGEDDARRVGRALGRRPETVTWR